MYQQQQHHFQNYFYDDYGQSHKNKSSDAATESSHTIMTPLDSDASDDCTLEVPLLQQTSSNNNEDAQRSSYNSGDQYDLECICVCQQKGFASNLDNNSTRTAKSRILWSVLLCCTFMVIEFLGGYIAGSLAVMTDAAHLASDCISFVIGLIAIWLGCKPPDARMSFGYKRFEVMGAILSILVIWILTATLVLLAVDRIYSNDYSLDPNIMMPISFIGILINIGMIFILHTSVPDSPAGTSGFTHGHSHSHSHNAHRCRSHSHSYTSTSTYQRHKNKSGHLHPTECATKSLLRTDGGGDDDNKVDAATDAIDTGKATAIKCLPEPMVLNENFLKHQHGQTKNINLRAAMIHVIGDLVQSFGVFLTAVLIKIAPRARILDPLCTLMFSIIVVMTTIKLFIEAMSLIMDAVPQGFSIDDFESDLLNIPGVKCVHKLNVWNHSSNERILMVHLVIDILADNYKVLRKATQLAQSAKYNIKHSTIQIETG